MMWILVPTSTAVTNLMIVTTCVIPLAVFVLFLWIIKAVTRMNFAIKPPKASNP